MKGSAHQSGAASPHRVDQDEPRRIDHHFRRKPMKRIVRNLYEAEGCLVLSLVKEGSASKIAIWRRFHKERLVILKVQTVEAKVGVSKHDLGIDSSSVAYLEI